MTRLSMLAALTITAACTSHAVLARSPARGMETASLTQAAAQADPTYGSPTTCPYQFDSDMPAGTFCVYLGIARGHSGEPCATDVVVIWSTSQTPGEVYLGFVTTLDLVVRAIVDTDQNDRAEIVEYTLAREAAPRPLAGQMTLPMVHPGAADVINMDLRVPRQFHLGSCAVTSYSGTFLGMMTPPASETSSID